MAAERPADLRRSLETIQQCLAVVAFRAKAVSVQESLGTRVGYPLRGPYYATLSRIGRAEEVTPSDLAELLEYEPSTVSRRVRALEERGLVERHTDPDDRRSYKLRLTKDGQAVFDALNEGWLDMIDEMVDGWSQDEVEAFAVQFDRFARRFEAMAQRSAPPGRSLLELWKLEGGREH